MILYLKEMKFQLNYIIKLFSEKLVRKLFNDIENRLLLIKENPEMYRVRESNFRIIPLKSYNILYKVFFEEKIIKIYSIVYSASNY